MNCKKCGSVLDVNDIVCKNCGEPVNNVGKENNQGMAVSSTVTGVVSPQQNIGAQDNLGVVNVGIDNTSQPQSNVQTVVQPNIVEQYNVQNVGGGNIGIPNQNLNINNNINQVSNINNGQGNAQPNVVMQSVNQPVNNQNIAANQAVPEKKKTNPIFIIIVILLVLVIIFLGYKLFLADKLSGDSSNSGSNTNSSDTVNEQNQVTQSNTVNFENFEFPVPSSYQANIIDGGFLQLINKTDRIMVNASLYPYAIEDIKENIDAVKNSLSGNDGIKIKSQDNKTISGVEWIIFDCTVIKEGETIDTAVDAFAQLGEYHSLELGILNLGTRDNNEIYEVFSKMINGATYKGTKNFGVEEPNEGIPSINGNLNFDKSVFD